MIKKFKNILIILYCIFLATCIIDTICVLIDIVMGLKNDITFQSMIGCIVSLLCNFLFQGGVFSIVGILQYCIYNSSKKKKKPIQFMPLVFVEAIKDGLCGLWMFIYYPFILNFNYPLGIIRSTFIVLNILCFIVLVIMDCMYIQQEMKSQKKLP